MHITIDELSDYLESLVDSHYHGKIILGLFDGKISSVKLDASIDLNAIKNINKGDVDDGE